MSEYIYTVNVFIKGYSCVEWLNIFGVIIFFIEVFVFTTFFYMWGFELRVSGLMNLKRFNSLWCLGLVNWLRFCHFIFLSCFHLVYICAWWNFEAVALNLRISSDVNKWDVLCRYWKKEHLLPWRICSACHQNQRIWLQTWIAK